MQQDRQPRTAPSTTASSNHFTFDLPLSPKSAKITENNMSKFSFKETGISGKKSKSDNCKMIQQDNDHFHTTNFIEGVKKSSSPISPGKSKYKTYNEGRELENGGTPYHHQYETHNNVDYDHDADYDSAYMDEDDKHISPGKKTGSSGTISKYRSNRQSSNTATLKVSPKREGRKPSSSSISSSTKVNSAHMHQKKLSPSSGHPNRKYSSSSSSGGSERIKDTATFPFDRESIDYERIQRECFAVDESCGGNSSTTSNSSDSDDPEPCSVYERKQHAEGNSPKSGNVFQQYTLLSQREQQISRKNSKRNRPDHNLIPMTDAFAPKTMQNSDTDHPNNISPKSYAELNKFEDIASKFDQIPPKQQQQQHHGSNTNLSINGNTNNNNNGILHSNGNNNMLTSPTGSFRGTPPRVDFFSESKKHPHQHPTTHHNKSKKHHKSSKSPHDHLEDCQNLSQNAGGVNITGSPGSINVTSNPMEAAVCTQPRATIVVQQVRI